MTSSESHASGSVRVEPTPASDTAFLDDFATMSTFGATTAGGVERQAATAADADNRRWLGRWLTDRGFTVLYDRVGNMFGLYELVPGAPTCSRVRIWTVSHAADASTVRTVCWPPPTRWTGCAVTTPTIRSEPCTTWR